MFRNDNFTLRLGVYLFESRLHDLGGEFVHIIKNDLQIDVVLAVG